MTYQEWLDSMTADGLRPGKLRDEPSGVPNVVKRLTRILFLPAGKPMGLNVKDVWAWILDPDTASEEVRFTDGTDPRPTSNKTEEELFEALVQKKISDEELHIDKLSYGVGKRSVTVSGIVAGAAIDQLWKLDASKTGIEASDITPRTVSSR